jgi:hypothetical protein
VGGLRITCNLTDCAGTQRTAANRVALRETSHRLKVIGILLFFVLCSSANAGASYQTGKLVSMTDLNSNRVIGNSQTGSVVSVTDIEYRLSVQLGDMVYVGSYWPRTRWSYSPTDFIVNDPVQVKIDGKHMYLKRPDGKELKTTVIQRIRANPSP